MRETYLLVVLGSAIWVAVDASRLAAKRGALGGGLLDMGPAGWFFACLLFWVVTFPCYLATRPKLVRRAQVLATHPQFTGTAHAAVAPMRSAPGHAYPPNFAQTITHPGYAPPQPGPALPPPGYYPNPNPNGFGTRWWDGARWESDTP